jgi:hypothetical protein
VSDEARAALRETVDMFSRALAEADEEIRELRVRLEYANAKAVDGYAHADALRAMLDLAVKHLHGDDYEQFDLERDRLLAKQSIAARKKTSEGKDEPSVPRVSATPTASRRWGSDARSKAHSSSRGPQCRCA